MSDNGEGDSTSAQTTVTYDSTAFYGLGVAAAIIFILSIVALILTIVGTVEMSKLKDPPTNVTVLTILSWVFALLIPIPVVNVGVPAALIYTVRSVVEK
jgi:hypothetical protein